MKNITLRINYCLSEEGRKRNLLNGGNGVTEQFAQKEILTEELKILFEKKYVKILDSGHVEMEYQYRKVKKIKWKIENKNVSFNYKTSDWTYYESEKPYLTHDKEELFYFNDEQTFDQLINLFDKMKKELLSLKPEMEKELQKCLLIYEEEKNKHIAKREEQKIITQEAKKAKEKIEKEKNNWIEKNGSDYLKDCLKFDYECQRAYVIERSEIEFPDYEIDFNDTANWNERITPSSNAFDEIKLLNNRNIKARIIWLTKLPTNNNKEESTNIEACEAIVIKDYLNRYDLIKII